MRKLKLKQKISLNLQGLPTKIISWYLQKERSVQIERSHQFKVLIVIINLKTRKIL